MGNLLKNLFLIQSVVHSVEIDFKVKTGCLTYPENISNQNAAQICTNARYHKSACYTETSIYTCFCDFSESNSILTIPKCDWVVTNNITDPVSTSPNQTTTTEVTAEYPTTTTQFREDNCENIQVTNGDIICDGHTGCYVSCDYGFVPEELVTKYLPDYEVKVNCNIPDQNFTCLPVSDICHLDLFPYKSDPLKTSDGGIH